jgi:hypothetical protein
MILEMSVCGCSGLRWAKMLLLCAEEDNSHKEVLIQALEDLALQLYQRPYLPRGTAERVFLLLDSLLTVRDACRRLFAAAIL